MLNSLPIVRFKEMVTRYPNNIALNTPRYTVSYSKLFEHSQAIAEAIDLNQNEAGGAPHTAILIEDSDTLATVASMLAALALGIPYSVIPENTPEERKASIFHNLLPSLIISPSGHSHAVSNDIPSLATEAITLSPGHAENFEVNFDLNKTIAYITYTSGSTGIPKGVMHTHANIMHEVSVHTEQLKITSDDVMSGFYGLGAIGSVRDLFGALLNGATYAPRLSTLSNALQFSQSVQQAGITHLHMVPSIYREFIATNPEKSSLTTVKSVFLAGDQVRWEDYKTFKKYFHEHAQFYTGIGSSEANSIYTHWFVKSDKIPLHERLPTGYPIDGKKVTLVDPETRVILKQSEIGEIRVSSRYLSPGYWRSKSLTDSFFDNIDGNERHYYTGDLGKWNAQGMLVHLGRKDRQIKINGQRIETVEIERKLRSFPGIDEVIVIASNNDSKKISLVAYFKSQPGRVSDVMTLRDFLGKSILPAAIPSVFIRVDSFKYTGIGKIDVSALPAAINGSNIPLSQDASQQNSGKNISALTENILHEIRSVLNKNDIGPHDDIRLWGCDSMNLVMLANVLYQKYGLLIKPELFTTNQAISANSLNAFSYIGENQSRSLDLSTLTSIQAQAWSWPRPPNSKLMESFPILKIANGNPQSKKAMLIWLTQAEDDCIWAQTLSSDRDVWLIPSGYRHISGKKSNVDAFVESMGQEILKDLPPDKDFILGGYCCSGSISLVLATYLKTNGRIPRNLFLVDSFGTKRSRDLARRLILRVFAHTKALKSYRITEWISYFRKATKRAIRRSSVAKPDSSMPYIPETRLQFDSPAWAHPITLIASSTISKWQLIIPNSGWANTRFPSLKRIAVRMNHYNFFSGNNGKKLADLLNNSTL